MEPRESGKVFDSALASYTRAVEAGRGGLLIAVCRGKVMRGAGGRGRSGSFWPSAHCSSLIAACHRLIV